MPFTMLLCNMERKQAALGSAGGGIPDIALIGARPLAVQDTIIRGAQKGELLLPFSCGSGAVTPGEM